ncbi:MAG TPA: O-methyltransferase [bacterium]|nr:O-methyltransferase [bacterium]
MSKSFARADEALQNYVLETFHPEDPVLLEIRERAAKEGLPDIHVGPMDGLHLEVIARSMGAEKIVEIGTLAGYSGVCLARALPAGGKLYCFEYEPKHAEVSRESFKRAGLADKAEIWVGDALANLPKIEAKGPFDLVFIDADKPGYPAYLAWAMEQLRVGGVVLGDNTFSGGRVADIAQETQGPKAETVKAIRAFNRTLADDPRFRATVIPTGEGLTFAVKVSN